MIKRIILLVCFMILPSVLLAQTYDRVICLAPSLTKSIYELQAEEKILGVTKFRPDEASSKEIIGDLQNINYEKVLLLKPEIVFAKADCTRPEVLRKIRSLGLLVKVFPEDINFSDISSNYIMLAELIGKKAQAEKIIKDINKVIKNIRERTAKKNEIRVFWQVGIKPVVTAGSKSFVNDIMIFAGLRNIFSDVAKTYFIAGPEEVVVRNPEIILYVAGMDEASKALDFWKRYPATDALRRSNIFPLNADSVCQPTPVRFLEALKKVIRIIETYNCNEEI